METQNKHSIKRQIVSILTAVIVVLTTCTCMLPFPAMGAETAVQEPITPVPAAAEPVADPAGQPAEDTGAAAPDAVDSGEVTAESETQGSEITDAAAPEVSSDSAETSDQEVVAGSSVDTASSAEVSQTGTEEEKAAEKQSGEEKKEQEQNEEKQLAVSPLVYDTPEYTVTVSFGENARIPEGTTLSWREFAAGSAEFDIYRTALNEKLKENGMNEDELETAITALRFFEILFYNKDGVQFFPADAVDVLVEYKEAANANENNQVSEESLYALTFRADDGQPVKANLITANAKDGSAGVEAENGFIRRLRVQSFPANDMYTNTVIGQAAVQSDSENPEDTWFVTTPDEEESLTTQYLTAEGEAYTITLTYGPEAGIPDDAALAVSEIAEASDTYDEYVSKTEDALEQTEKVVFARFFDITIVKDGVEIQPNDTVNVKIELADTLPEDIKVIHFEHEDAAAAIETPVVLDAEPAEAETLENAVEFEAETFSIYGVVIVDTLPEGEFITKTYEDEQWLITAAYTADANIPKQAELRVSELTHRSDPEAYEENAQMVFDIDDESLIYAMLDIGFWTDGEEVEPEDTVYVTIQFKDTEQHKAGDVVTIYHREEEGLSCVSLGELNENLEAEYEVDSFSLFVITNQGTIEWRQWTTATSNYDPDWVSRGGTVQSFTSNLPLGTAAITKSMAVNQRTSFTTTNSNLFYISGNSVACKNLKNTPGTDTYYEGSFTVTWADAVTLQDGTTADLVVTGNNLKSRNCTGSNTNLFSGTSVNVSKTGGGLSIDLNYSVQKNGEILPGYTLLFGVNDIDQPDRVSNYTYYKVQRATDGLSTLIGVQASTPGSVRFTELLTDQDAQGGKIQLANTSGQRLYWTDESETATTTEVTEWPVYAIYKVMRETGQLNGTSHQTSTSTGSDNYSSQTSYGNVYITREPVSYTESVSIAGEKSRIYIPDHNYLHFEMLDGLKRMVSVTGDSTSGSGAGGTAATGFFALVDSAGYTIRYTGSQSIGITLTSGSAYYKIISTTGNGGNITTTDTDISGNQVTYGPGLLAVPKGKTVPYTMTPETFYHAKTVTIWDTTQVPENRSVIPIGDMLDEEAWIDVDGESYTQKTVTVPYKDESDEYSKNPPDGTQSTISYILRKDSSGVITGYTTAETTDPETGETTVSETQVFTYAGSTFTDTVRNVSYGITIDENGVLQYTFSNVQANHWIDVRWEKDPPQEAVIITKEWEDNGNARQARPENITVHLVSTNGVKFNNDNTELVTGTDANINGNTNWVKDGNKWTYTFGNIPASAEFAVYEDSVPDYTSENAGSENTKAVTEYTESMDEATGIVTRTYTVTIANTLKPGVLEFTKLGEKMGSEDTEYEPLPGAVFSLYTDSQCLYPVTRMVAETDAETGETVMRTENVTATSGSDGKVSLTDVPCGMYYMKETTVPDNYAANAALYQVWIREDKTQSTITVVTADPDGSGTLEGTAAQGYTIKDNLAKFDVILLKVSASNNQLRLPSALFVLYGSDYLDEGGNVNENAEPLSLPIEASKWYDANVGTSNNTRYRNIASEEEKTFYSSRSGSQSNFTSVYGRAPLGSLKSGTYYLVELGAPTGYNYPAHPVTSIHVGQDGVTAMPVGGEAAYSVTSTVTSGVYTYTVAVPNTPGEELPLTGGMGTKLFYIIGAILAVGAGIILVTRRRTRRG